MPGSESVLNAAVMNSERGWLAGSPLAAPAGLVAMLLIGAAVGWLNGLAITRLRMPPFMVTLTAMMFFSGLAIWLTRSRNINQLPAAFNAIGGRTWTISGPLPASVPGTLAKSADGTFTLYLTETSGVRASPREPDKAAQKSVESGK